MHFHNLLVFGVYSDFLKKIIVQFWDDTENTIDLQTFFWNRNHNLVRFSKSQREYNLYGSMHPFHYSLSS